MILLQNAPRPFDRPPPPQPPLPSLKNPLPWTESIFNSLDVSES